MDMVSDSNNPHFDLPLVPLQICHSPQLMASTSYTQAMHPVQLGSPDCASLYMACLQPAPSFQADEGFGRSCKLTSQVAPRIQPTPLHVALQIEHSLLSLTNHLQHRSVATTPAIPTAGQQNKPSSWHCTCVSLCCSVLYYLIVDVC